MPIRKSSIDKYQYDISLVRNRVVKQVASMSISCRGFDPRSALPFFFGVLFF